ncbi:MAG: class I SAM-dependent methyltransferase, partial [Phycisphaerae bacterium]|nr:class I SAM-dependent methyltransferase [Phycisphaerae bacterium]MDW8262437.1 class I SAM-dependent methyltransferase [Phycisphaerales bacterium]
MKQRQRAAEWMDSPSVGIDDLRKSLRFIEQINHRLGYTRATLSHLRRMLLRHELARSPDGGAGNRPIAATDLFGGGGSVTAGETLPVMILDIATGSGDVPRAILSWADRAGVNLRVVAVDRHPLTLQIARERSAGLENRLSFVQADALALPFATGSFDYVLCSMFLHHLDDSDAAKVITAADRIARRGVVI